MIQANELRIGNYINKKGVGLVKVGYSVFESFNMYPKGGIGFEPIPLTPEILEKAGFQKTEVTTKSYEWNNESTITYFSIGYKAMKQIVIRVQQFDNEVKYVCDNILNYVESLHQLQNLYYALTGQELKITM